MVAPRAYAALVAAVAGQRLVEMRASRRNQAALVANGATVHARHQLPAAVALHAGWLAASLAEGTARLRRSPPGTTASVSRVALGLAGLAAGHGLRLASMRALGERWTASVVVVPGALRVRSGIYRRLRHPNYLGVAVEVAALPLVAGAWRTAAAFSLLNAAFLRVRIRAEDAALDQGRPHPGPSAHALSPPAHA